MLFEIAHHGLLEFLGARPGGAGDQEYPSLPSQPANDVLGPALGFLVGNTTFLLALLDMFSLTFLLVRVTGFVAARHGDLP